MHVSMAWAKPQRVNLILIGGVEATSHWVVLDSVGIPETREKATLKQVSLGLPLNP
jgi:hypothetical protein